MIVVKYSGKAINLNYHSTLIYSNLHKPLTKDNNVAFVKIENKISIRYWVQR
jgi:hypothetical protein